MTVNTKFHDCNHQISKMIKTLVRMKTRDTCIYHLKTILGLKPFQTRILYGTNEKLYFKKRRYGVVTSWG